MNTSELRLATGIALALTRSPLETAFAALDLDHLSGGRFTLGLGTSVRWWHEDLFGVPYDRPVARLAEAVRIIRLVLSGQAKASGRFDGEFWQLDFSRLAMKPPVRPSLPVCEMAKSFALSSAARREKSPIDWNRCGQLRTRCACSRHRYPQHSDPPTKLASQNS